MGAEMTEASAYLIVAYEAAVEHHMGHEGDHSETWSALLDSTDRYHVRNFASSHDDDLDAFALAYVFEMV